MSGRKSIPSVVQLRLLAALYRLGRPASAAEIRSQVAEHFDGADREPAHDLRALERQGFARTVDVLTAPKYWAPTPYAFQELKRAARYFQTLADYLNPEEKNP